MHFLSLVFLCHRPFINMQFIGNSTETVRRGKHLLRGQHPNIREIILYSGGPHHLSIISLKNFHLFKITESVINFYLKYFSN